MTPLRDVIQPEVTTIDFEGRSVQVTCRIAFDGIEYVGRLWFADKEQSESGLPDRGAIPGRTRDEVVELTRRLTPADLALRYRRAIAERRRFHELRRATDEILTKIRYLNQVSISMRAHLLDEEGAAQEIDLTERQLHDLVTKLRLTAGLTDEE